MRCDFSMGNTSMKFIAGAVLLCLASAASAATTLVGGGATLPAVGYTGAATGSPITPAAGSLFGVYTAGGGNPVTYCPTGSGAGKKILAGNDPTNFQVNGACGGTAPSGFGPASTLTQAFFAGSDAPLSLSEYTNYVTGHGTGSQPTQLPSIAGAIAVVFKKTGVNTLTLTEDQICGVFSGTITDWSSLVSTASGPINVVYRSDGSGTSFSFLNHLSAVCPSLPSHAVNFKTLQAFSTGAASYIPSYASSLPAGGANGNAGVTTAVNATEGSIGYAEAANGIAAPAKMASVKNTAGTVVNPLTGFGPTAVSVAVTFDKAISDSVDANGRPVLVSLPATSNGCIGLVDPSTYANPAGYPIIAITNLLGNAQGNGSDAAAVRTLLGTPYNTTTRTTVSRIGRVNTGYAWLASADLTQARVNACIN